MTRTTGRSAFLSLLKDEGITHLFGNPGTTELPVMHALMDRPELTYVIAMQESLVVAMADGFSRALAVIRMTPFELDIERQRFGNEWLLEGAASLRKRAAGVFSGEGGPFPPRAR